MADDASSELLAERAELLAEQLSRNTAFFGEEGQARVAAARVVVVGMGGVGSHAAQLLARTGVGRLRFVDAARVDEASLRTHALAARSDLGAQKAAASRDELLRTVPHTVIDVTAEALDAENAASLVDGADMALFCMQDVAAVAIGVDTCERLGVRCLAVLGEAGSRAAAKQVAHQRLSYLHDAWGCLQARRLTARLRALSRAKPPPPLVCAGMLVVHSGADPHDPSRAAEQSASASARGDLGAISAVGAVRAGLGHATAAACLSQLAGLGVSCSTDLVLRSRREDMHRHLARREREAFGCREPLAVWPEDIEFLVARRRALSIRMARRVSLSFRMARRVSLSIRMARRGLTHECGRLPSGRRVGWALRAERQLSRRRAHAVAHSVGSLQARKPEPSPNLPRTFHRWDRSKPAAVDNLCASACGSLLPHSSPHSAQRLGARHTLDSSAHLLTPLHAMRAGCF